MFPWVLICLIILIISSSLFLLLYLFNSFSLFLGFEFEQLLESELSFVTKYILSYLIDYARRPFPIRLTFSLQSNFPHFHFLELAPRKQ